MTIEDRSYQSLAVCVAATIATTLAVGLRFISRRTAKAPYGWDDALIVLALIVNYGMIGGTLAAYKYGLGKHTADVPLEAQFKWLKTIWAIETLYQADICGYKLSVLTLYARLFSTNYRFRILVRVLITLVCMYMVWSVLQNIFQCIPVQTNWTVRLHADPHTHCIPPQTHLLSISIPNVILDWTIFFLPMPMIWKLHTSNFRKAELIATFAVGIFVCISSIIRMTTIINLDQLDYTYSYNSPVCWSVAEPSVGVICACLPTLRPVFHRLFGRFDTQALSRYYRSRRSSKKGTTNVRTEGSDAPSSNSAVAPKGPFVRLKGGGKGNYDFREYDYHAETRSERKGDDVSEAELPLKSIHVRTEVDIETV